MSSQPMMAPATPTSADATFDAATIEKLKKSKDASNLVSWVNEQYTKMKSAREPYERQWRLNYAMYKGKQYLAYTNQNIGYNMGGGRLITPPAPPYRVRSVRNLIKPIIRTELSKLTSNKPNASIVPSSNEDKDLYAAQAGEQVWESLYSTKNMHKIFTRSMFWLTICGTSFIKDWWDPNVTEKCGDVTYQGDIALGAVTPFHLFVPDLMEEEIEDQPWVLNAYTKSVEWIKSTYGIDLAADTVSANELLGDSFFHSVKDNQAKPDSVLVKEMWFKPNAHKLFPQGGMCTVAGDTLVGMWADSMLYAHEEYPFTRFSHIPTGEFYSDSVINDLIQPQRDYNRTSSQIIESKNRMARPQLMAEKGSIDAKKITTEPGLIIEYRPGMNPPSPLPLQPLPSYVLQELERAKADMEDISSQHEVSKGQTPSGVTAATAISYLQERDDTAMSTTYQSIEMGYEKIAKHTLSHVVQFWDVPRVVKTTGTNGFFDAITLKGSEIGTGTDIRMEAGSALPISKAAKQAFLLDMMKLGFLDPDKGLEMMEMGGVEKLYDELKADERAAGRENLRMAALEINAIQMHMQQVATAQELSDQMAQQMAPQMEQSQVAQTLPGLPQDVADPNDAMTAVQGLEQMTQPTDAPPEMQMDLGFGQDAQTQMPLQIPPNMVAVNTWDNHQVHIEVHNRYRKGQQFEILPDQVKAQFEAHVQAHAMALNQASMNAMAMMPGPNPMDNPLGGAHNGSGTPVGPQGSNQFGPPGDPSQQGGQ